MGSLTVLDGAHAAPVARAWHSPVSLWEASCCRLATCCALLASLVAPSCTLHHMPALQLGGYAHGQLSCSACASPVPAIEQERQHGADLAPHDKS